MKTYALIILRNAYKFSGLRRLAVIQQTLSTDGTLSITCDGALDKLTGIYVDGKLVDAANYTLQSGSTILTFNASYLTICIIVMAIPNAC